MRKLEVPKDISALPPSSLPFPLLTLLPSFKIHLPQALVWNGSFCEQTIPDHMISHYHPLCSTPR